MIQKKHKVYVLTLNEKPIYVGETSNIPRRLKAHKLKGKIFDSYTIIESFETKEQSLISERSIIKYLSYFKNIDITNKLYSNKEVQLKYNKKI